MKALVLALALLFGALSSTQHITNVVLPGLQGWEETPLHSAVVYMVARCLGIHESAYTLIGWAVADQLVLVDSGIPAYGVTVLDPENRTALIVLERAYWLHPGVISHEAIHLLTGVEDDDYANMALWRCEMRLPQELPQREALSPDSVAILIDVASRTP